MHKFDKLINTIDNFGEKDCSALLNRVQKQLTSNYDQLEYTQERNINLEKLLDNE